MKSVRCLWRILRDWPLVASKGEGHGSQFQTISKRRKTQQQLHTTFEDECGSNPSIQKYSPSANKWASDHSEYGSPVIRNSRSHEGLKSKAKL